MQQILQKNLKSVVFIENINEFMIENIAKDGRIYFLPSTCYDVGPCQ